MYTLTFSHIQDGNRVPLIINGQEAQLQVEAASKTEAIYKPEVKTFCDENHCRVRRVV